MLNTYLFIRQHVYHFPLYKMIRVTRQNFVALLHPFNPTTTAYTINRSTTSLLSLFNTHLRNFKAYIVWLSRPHDYICGAYVICHLPNITKLSNIIH